MVLSYLKLNLNFVSIQLCREACYLSCLGNPPFPGNQTFSLLVNPLNLEFSNQAKYISVGLPSSPINIWGKSVKGFKSYDRTSNKQTEITTLYIKICSNRKLQLINSSSQVSANSFKYFISYWYITTKYHKRCFENI